MPTPLPRRLSLALVVLTGACGAGPRAERSSDPEQATVQGDVETCVRALYSGDFDTVLGLTHPRILEQLGGRDRVRAAMVEGLAPVRDGGMRVEAFRFPKPPDILPAGARRYAVVPTLAVFALGDQRIESLNFQVGVLEPGAREWKYVEGARLNAGNVQTMFPDFPRGYVFPPTYRKRL